MEVQPSLVLLQKTLLNVEGLGRELYPDLNLWDTAMPFLETWMAERYAPSGLLKQIQRHAPDWLEQLPQVPDLLLNNLQMGPAGATPSSLHAEIAQLRSEIETKQRSSNNKLLACVVLITGIMMAKPNLISNIGDGNGLAYGLTAVGLLLLLRA